MAHRQLGGGGYRSQTGTMSTRKSTLCWCCLQIIDNEMQSQERLKQQRLTLKSQVDDMEQEISEVRKRLSVQQKEMAAMQKSITSMETKLEQKRADRHSLLKACKVGTPGMEIDRFCQSMVVDRQSA